MGQHHMGPRYMTLSKEGFQITPNTELSNLTTTKIIMYKGSLTTSALMDIISFIIQEILWQILPL